MRFKYESKLGRKTCWKREILFYYDVFLKIDGGLPGFGVKNCLGERKAMSQIHKRDETLVIYRSVITLSHRLLYMLSLQFLYKRETSLR